MTSFEFESRTRAILRSAEFGFFGVMGLDLQADAALLRAGVEHGRLCSSCSSFLRPLRTSWLIVGIWWVYRRVSAVDSRPGRNFLGGGGRKIKTFKRPPHRGLARGAGVRLIRRIGVVAAVGGSVGGRPPRSGCPSTGARWRSPRSSIALEADASSPPMVGQEPFGALSRGDLGGTRPAEVDVLLHAGLSGSGLEAGPGRHQVAEDHVLLEADQVVGLAGEAASVSTLVVSWKEAAEMNDSDCSEALVMPSSSG